jgi:predicted ATPase
MLRSLSLKNFKSWREVKSLRFGRITGLFGTNSSGKTSLLQLLLLLKQTAESADRALPLHLGDERSLVELGTFRELLHGHDLARELEWSLTWELPEPLKIVDPERQGAALYVGDELTHQARVGWLNGSGSSGRMVTREHNYHFADATFGMLAKAEKKDEFELTPTTGKGFRFIRAQGRPWPLPAPTKCYGFPDQARGYYQNAGFLADFELAFESLFSRVFYLGPLREYPQREYPWAGGRPSDMGRRGERVVDALLASREWGATLSQGRGKARLTVEERVAKWLKELKLIHDFQVTPVAPESKLYQVVVKRSAASAPVLITDVGFGVSQILPVITLCYYAPEGSVLIFEQPEIHLHPAVQAGLADVFIHAAKTRNVQIVLESHSEHLLRRLQRRIAEEKLATDEAALYFCDAAKTESKLVPLDMNLFGAIENWPEDFFGDEFGELAATQEAIIQRQQRAGS